MIEGEDNIAGAPKGVSAASVSLSGMDTSGITAEVDTTAIAAAFGAVAVGGAVGVSQATNEITNNMQVYIANAGDGVSATSGSVSVSANESATITSPGPAPISRAILSPTRADCAIQPAVFQLRTRPLPHSSVTTAATRAAADAPFQTAAEAQ